MFCIENRCTDIYFNLAAEEYLLKKKPGSYFMLWQNTPSVVVGKHQSIAAEVDMEFVQQRNIHVARRFSGGGAVYHDAGNINLTFIGASGGAGFDYYLQQVIDFLHSIGISAHSDERLGIYIDHLKISGSAQCVHKDRMMHHCTLLFDTDLDALKASLAGKAWVDEPAPGSHAVRAVPSVRSEVTNISDHLHEALDIKRFMRLLFHYFLEDDYGNRIYRFTREETMTIEQLMREKYACREWIYSKSELKTG